MSRRKLTLWLICILALATISPARVRMWAYEPGLLRPWNQTGPLSVSDSRAEVDLDADGSRELALLEHGRAQLQSGRRTVWTSPAAWEVAEVAMADLNRDGRPEVVLLVWRPFQPWPIDRYLAHPGRIDGFHNAAGRSCHIILIGWARGAYREVWAGSAMAEPFLAMAVADLDQDGRDELLALEGRYTDRPDAPARALTAWEWNGFGFTLLARAHGSFRQMRVAAAADGSTTILTQE